LPLPLLPLSLLLLLLLLLLLPPLPPLLPPLPPLSLLLPPPATAAVCHCRGRCHRRGRHGIIRPWRPWVALAPLVPPNPRAMWY
jgi:hypothetical protein